MYKRAQLEMQRGLAPQSIGLGPNFIAGETVDVVVETQRGAQLGQVIFQGAARSLEGEPTEIGGHARERFVYTPHAGLFRTPHQIGALVRVGEIGRCGENCVIRRGEAFGDASATRYTAANPNASPLPRIYTQSAIPPEIVAHVDATPLFAPMDGALRGLTHDGVPVNAKTKVIKVDPRGTAGSVRGIGERPARIARGVAEAIELHSFLYSRRAYNAHND